VPEPGNSFTSSALIAASSFFTQTPLNEQEFLSPSGDFAAMPFSANFDPSLEPAVATTFESSAFLYADDYNLVGEDGLEAQLPAEDRSSEAASAQVLSGNVLPEADDDDSDLDEAREAAEKQQAVEQDLAKTSLSEDPLVRGAQTGSSSPTNPAERLSASASPTTRPSGGSEIRASVINVSSEEAADRFTQGEAKAQSETAEKLGLAGDAGPPPTPAQIQGLLQRVMQSLRGPSASAR
jgi:hypothetical protein